MFSRLGEAGQRACVIAGGLLLGVRALAGAPEFLLENNQLQVGFNRTDGQLVQFTDRKAHWNHIAAQAGPLGLWKLDLLRDGRKIELTPADAKRVRHERGRDRYSLQLSWAEFGSGVDPQLKVTVETRLEPGQAMSYWTITVANLHGLVLDKVHFPQVPAVRPQADERLAVPLWMGQVAPNPRSLLTGAAGKGSRMEWDYPGMASLQCLAFYRQNGPGLYLSCDDTASFRKSFALWGSEGGQVNYELIHLPERREANNYTLPYHAIIGAFEGDWFTAADRYRSWATNQVWARESRLAAGRTPDWALETGMWVWNRGRSAGVLGPGGGLAEGTGVAGERVLALVAWLRLRHRLS